MRAGFGIYHADGQLDDQNLPIANEVERYSLASKQTPNLSFPIDPFLATTPGIVSPREMSRLRSDMYVIQWGTSIQHGFSKDWVATVGYAGSRGNHLLTTSYVNVIDPLTGLRPYANFGQGRVSRQSQCQLLQCTSDLASAQLRQRSASVLALHVVA